MSRAPTQQDRQLAERIASQRAKEQAREVGNWLDIKLSEPQGLNALALRFDDFAATLLAEAREAQHKASWANVESQLLGLLEGEYSHLHLTFNDHAGSYETVKENEESGGAFGDWVSDDEKEKGIAANKKWTLQYYPLTPIGFNVLSASSLPALMAAALPTPPITNEGE